MTNGMDLQDPLSVASAVKEGPDYSAVSTNVQITKAVEQIYQLNVRIIGQGAERHERPHKPLLLLAVLKLIQESAASPTRVLWNEQLREQFSRYFEIVRQRDDKSTPENPFLYLRSDGFWRPFSLTNGDTPRPLETTPTVADASADRVYAQFSPEWVKLLQSATSREELRDAIIARYFPAWRVALGGSSEVIDSEAELKVAEEEPEGVVYARSSAFRRRVLEIYDFQCAACGLRIKLPPLDLTFVDAAHLIPFFESGNDHPTNGLALCKNHHWAMDRHIIAPTPDLRWEVSQTLDARRSPGEKELLGLHGQRVLIPAEEAFRPSADALEWRVSRLIA